MAVVEGRSHFRRLTISLLLLASEGVLVRPKEAGSSAVDGQTELPSLILMLADDLGYGDLPVYGNTSVETPNLDVLASEGAVFDAM